MIMVRVPESLSNYDATIYAFVFATIQNNGNKVYNSFYVEEKIIIKFIYPEKKRKNVVN